VLCKERELIQTLYKYLRLSLSLHFLYFLDGAGYGVFEVKVAIVFDCECASFLKVDQQRSKVDISLWRYRIPEKRPQLTPGDTHIS